MKIEHIALYVKDLETARSFFVKYLGAKSNEGYHNLKTGICPHWVCAHCIQRRQQRKSRCVDR